MTSPAEHYLDAWHRRHLDATRVFAAMRDEAGRTSYERLAALVSSERIVLDVACGAGGLLALLHPVAAPRVLIGVDFCEPELALAASAVPAAAFMRARAQVLPFAEHSIDFILCHMALMLMDSPEDVLRECRRVLLPGATIATTTNSLAVPDGLMKTVFGELRQALRSGDASRQPPPLGDARTQTATGLVTLMGAYFTDVRVEEFMVAQTLPRRDLWSFMVQSIYGLDAIPDSEGERIIGGLDLPDLVTWAVPMVQMRARVPHA